MERTRASNLFTVIALAISMGWGALIGYLVVQSTRTNAWYDMDFSFWMICLLYGFVHLFIGKILCMLVTWLIETLEKKRGISLMTHWTENSQMIAASLWPVSIPILFIAFLLLMAIKNQEKRTPGSQG